MQPKKRMKKHALLTHQELKVLGEFVKGQTAEEVAHALGVSKNTVNKQKTHIYQKLEVKNSAQLTAYYHENAELQEAVQETQDNPHVIPTHVTFERKALQEALNECEGEKITFEFYMQVVRENKKKQASTNSNQ